MQPFDYLPGVPALGHTAGGFWHSGNKSTCSKCRNAEERRKTLREKQEEQRGPR